MRLGVLHRLGVLLDWRGFSAAWIGSALFALLALASISRVPETGEHAPEGAEPAPLIHRAAIRPGLALLTGVAATAGFLALIGLHATAVGFRAWSVVPLIFGLIVVACRIIFARLPDRVPPLTLAAASLAICSVALAMLAVIGAPGGVLAGTGVLAIGVALLTPAIFAAVFGAVPAHERGAAAGTTTIFIDLGLGGGALLLGQISSIAGISVAFGVAGAMTAAGGMLLVRATNSRSATD